MNESDLQQILKEIEKHFARLNLGWYFTQIRQEMQDLEGVKIENPSLYFDKYLSKLISLLERGSFDKLKSIQSDLSEILDVPVRLDLNYSQKYSESDTETIPMTEITYDSRELIQALIIIKNENEKNAWQ